MVFVLRTLLRIFLWGVLALFCLFLVAVAINARDEPLSPEAEALLQLPVNPYTPEQNIYVALAGLDAPPGQSVVAAGLTKIALYNSPVDVILQDPSKAPADQIPADSLALKFQGNVAFGSPREPRFWEAVRGNRSAVSLLVEQNRELYERYLALHELLGYFGSGRASPGWDVFYPPPPQRSLFLAIFSIAMQTGDEAQRQAALTDLRKDIDLWRRVFAGEGNLLSKMLAVTYFQEDYLVLSDMIADPDTALPDNIDELFPAPDLSAWNIRKVFASEFRFRSIALRQTQVFLANAQPPPDGTDSQIGRWFDGTLRNQISSWFFKLNATENLDATLMNKLAGFAAIDPATFAAQRAQYRQWADANADLMKLRTLYNPLGTIVIRIGVPAYENYLLRPYDAAALQRLVRLSLEIRRQQIAPAAIPAFLKLHPEWSTHPANGHSFAWSTETDAIAIHTIARPSSSARFWVQIWRKPPHRSVAD